MSKKSEAPSVIKYTCQNCATGHAPSAMCPSVMAASEYARLNWQGVPFTPPTPSKTACVCSLCLQRVKEVQAP